MYGCKGGGRRVRNIFEEISGEVQKRKQQEIDDWGDSSRRCRPVQCLPGDSHFGNSHLIIRSFIETVIDVGVVKCSSVNWICETQPDINSYPGCEQCWRRPKFSHERSEGTLPPCSLKQIIIFKMLFKSKTVTAVAERV
jgi:hypothetical protein